MITQLINCWRINSSGMQDLLFTDHVHNIDMQGTIFKADRELAITNSSITTKNCAEADIMDVTINFFGYNNFFIQASLGLLDNAKIFHFKVDLTQRPLKKLFLFSGWCKEIVISKFAIFIKAESLKTKLTAHNVGEFYSPYCRAQFGDKKCTVLVEKYTRKSTIKEIMDDNTLTTDSSYSTDFTPNTAVFPLLQNRAIAILSAKEYTISLATPLPIQLKKEDPILLQLICDNRYESCCNTFKNIKNFRGEPFIC